MEELAGKRVARQQASFQDRYLQGLLEQEGVEGVQLQAMLNPQAVAALRKGALDAAAIATVQSKALADEGFPVLDKSDDHPDLQGTSITTIRDDFAKEHPDVAQAFVDAHFKALELAKADADDYYAYQATATGVPEEVVRVWDPIESYPAEPFTAEGVEAAPGHAGLPRRPEARQAVRARGLGHQAGVARRRGAHAASAPLAQRLRRGGRTAGRRSTSAATATPPGRCPRRR